MFIKFKVKDPLGGEPTTEICTFEGIRYETAPSLAILSTEHSLHDYLLPMTRDVYDRFVDELFTLVSKSLIKPGIMAIISGSPLIRVRHGSVTQVENPGVYGYALSSIYGGASWVQHP